jgi:adenosine deaminase
LDVSLLYTLAKKNNIVLPDEPCFASASALNDRYQNFSGLDDYLHYNAIGTSVLIHKEDFEAAVWSYFQHAKADGVAHVDMFFSPQAHVSRGVSVETVVEGFSAAQKRANGLGVTSSIVPCLLRHLPPDEGYTTYTSLVDGLRNGTFSGMGLSSTEKVNHTSQFAPIFNGAAQEGFNLTAHVAEEGTVDNISVAVHGMGVKRIDHALKLRLDRDLMDEVVRQGILVTMCPLSNQALRCITEISELPVRTYLDAGVRFSINSDNPGYLGHYTLDNYLAVQKYFQLTYKEWISVLRNSIMANWCSQERKDELLIALADVVKAFS